MIAQRATSKQSWSHSLCRSHSVCLRSHGASTPYPPCQLHLNLSLKGACRDVIGTTVEGTSTMQEPQVWFKEVLNLTISSSTAFRKHAVVMTQHHKGSSLSFSSTSASAWTYDSLQTNDNCIHMTGAVRYSRSTTGIEVGGMAPTSVTMRVT